MNIPTHAKRPLDPQRDNIDATVAAMSPGWKRRGRAREILIAMVAIGIVGISIAGSSGAIAGGVAAAFGASLGLLMLAIAAIDARHFIIPDSLNAAALVLGLAYAAALAPDAITSAMSLALMRATGLAVVFLIFRGAYAYLRGRQGIGLGDVKLACVAGAWLDWLTIPIVIELAALVALAAYFLSRVTGGRPILATHRVPFGLFFAPAIWVGWLLESSWLAPI
jgi:leader peptidase (prepilin peptidase) / N-methyltransferase